MVLATFLVFFFLRDGDKAWVWIFQAVERPEARADHRRPATTPSPRRRLPARAPRSCRRSSRSPTSCSCWCWACRWPLPLAVLVFLSGYIPYFGGIVTTALILLVTYAALGAGPVVVMLVLIGVRNVILGYGVRPAVYGRTVSIHPALVLVALPAGFELAGIIGLFAAVPVTAVLLAVARRPSRSWTRTRAPSCPASCRPGSTGSPSGAGGSSSRLGLVALFVGIFVAIPLVVVPVVLATILAATLDPLVQRARCGGAGPGAGPPRSRSAAGSSRSSASWSSRCISLVDQAGDLAGGDVVRRRVSRRRHGRPAGPAAGRRDAGWRGARSRPSPRPRPRSARSP